MAQHVDAYAHDPPPTPGLEPVSVRVRGTRDGLVLSVPEDAAAAPARDVAAALAAHLDTAEAFFQGAEVIVDLGAREFTESEVSFYRLVLEEREVGIRGFTAKNPEGRALLRRLGYHPLQLEAERPRVATPLAPGAVASTGTPLVSGQLAEGSEALYLRRTLRSGARVRHHGNLVVVGDINAGAEAIAAGDIVVWGMVRGTVHAGALGDDSAIICGLGLLPTQLRIGSHYALPPAEKKGKPARGPERARLDNGQVIVEPWKL